LFIIIFGITNLGCANSNEKNDFGERNDSDEYYVKYKMNWSSIYSGFNFNITITRENNNIMTINTLHRVKL
jgi:hypothetical protein